MGVCRGMLAAVLASVVMVGAAGAQSLSQINGPAELPPATFGGNEYADSAGCAFVRANLGGKVVWLQRLDKNRKPVCGFVPTFTAGPSEVPKSPADGQELAGQAAPAPTADQPATDLSSKIITDQPVVRAVPRASAKPRAKTAPRRMTQRRSPAAVATAVVEPGTRLVEDHLVIGHDTHCQAQMDWARRYLLSDGRRVVTCDNKRPNAPVAHINGLGAPNLTVEDRPASEAEAARARAIEKSATYRVVWQNGKLKDGTSATKANVANTAPAKPASAKAVAPAEWFVQVGAFGDPANVHRAVIQLKALGLPVAILRKRNIGEGLQKVLAGPFENTSDLYAALSLVRRNGYADAYPRR